ncbi:MAG: hypothetical protein P8X89_14040 [Reinekea sp.]
MDSVNSNHYNAEHYYSYSQIPQEGGQAGQTSAGASWSQPAPGQLYPNPNWQAQIPSSPEQDLEYLLRTPQPIAVEDIIQNDALPNPQPAVGKRRGKARQELPSPKERFLAGLDHYAQGAKLKDCSATLPFSDYIHCDGSLAKRGRFLYDSFTKAEKTRLNQAITARQGAIPERMVDEDIVKEHFLAGLDHYAQGVPLKGCSANVKFKTYVTDTGRLTKAGVDLCSSLPSEDWDRVNQALCSRRQLASGPVAIRFLAGLDNYARGVNLVDCSAILIFKAYVTDDGRLSKRGQKLRTDLSPEDRARLDQALFCRREIYSRRVMGKDPVAERFLAGLDNYARGVCLSQCSTDIIFYHYVTDDGRLRPERGQRLYNKLGPDDKVRVNQALTARRRIASERLSGDLDQFMATLEAYGDGLNLLDCETQSGFMGTVTTYLTSEGGLTYKGELLIENLQPDQQIDVWYAIEKRRQFLDPSAQIPESIWQLPEMSSSMPELGGMDPTLMVDPIRTEAMYDPMQTEAAYDPMQTGAMYDPMQTEAAYDPMQTGTMVDPIWTETMWATAWQLTGQAVPGPSESAEPPTPYYDSGAVGADFQHQYGSERADTTVSAGPPHRPGNRAQYADQYPGLGVQDMGSSGNPTNEEPQGKRFIALSRMRGG